MKEKMKEELLEALILSERLRNKIEGEVSKLAKGEVAVLMYLNEHDGANAKDLSQFLDINTSRVAAILNSLCKKGYIIRNQDIDDKRKIQVYMTKEGNDFYIQQRKKVLSHLSKFIDIIGEEDVKKHIETLKKISKVFLDMK